MENIKEKYAWEKVEDSKLGYFARAVVVVGGFLYVSVHGGRTLRRLDIATEEWHHITLEKPPDKMHALVDDRILCVDYSINRFYVTFIDLALDQCTEHLVSLNDISPNRYHVHYMEFNRQIAVLDAYKRGTKENQQEELGMSTGQKQKRKNVTKLSFAFFDVDILTAIPLDTKGKVKGKVPIARELHSSCVVNRDYDATIYICGGTYFIDGEEKPRIYDDLDLLHYCGKFLKWSSVKRRVSIMTKGSSLTYRDGKLFLYGGTDSEEGRHNTIEIYELGTKSWHTLCETGEYRISPDGKPDISIAEPTVGSTSKGLYIFSLFEPRLEAGIRVLKPVLC